MGVSPRTGDAHKGLCYKDLGAFLQFCPNAPDRDYCPFAADEVGATRALGEVLPKVADHFDAATKHLEKAIEVLDHNHRSAHEHWYQQDDGSLRQRLTPRQSLEKQLTAVRIHARNQRRMGRFFAAYSLVKSMPEEGQPGYEAALGKLEALREAEDAGR